MPALLYGCRRSIRSVLQDILLTRRVTMNDLQARPVANRFPPSFDRCLT